MKLKHLLGGLALALASAIAQAASLVVLPQQLVVDVNGAPRSGAKLWTYQCNSSTPLTTYTTQAIAVQHANPVESVSTGLFPAIYTSANVTCIKVTLTDSADALIYTEDNIPTGGSVAFPIDVRSFGVVADSTGARADNCEALIDLVGAATAGPEGHVVFPNESGTTTYYFAPCVADIRDRITLDLNGSTLDFDGAYDAATDLSGFLNCIRDCVIENGAINVNYAATSDGGYVILLGSRTSYSFGSDLDGIEDEDEALPMGNIVLRQLRITTNNPRHGILMLGGLVNTTLDTIDFDGGGEAISVVAYEFGFWHDEATAANKESSHAINLKLRNIHGKNLDTAGVCADLVGGMSVSIDGLWCDDAASVFVGRPGEALYYNMGDPYDGMQAQYDLRNLNGINISSTGISLNGAESAAGGYLAATIAALAAEPEAIAQTDLISFNLDGFYLGDSGITAEGRHVRIANGTVKGDNDGIVLQDELPSFSIDNTRILDNLGNGIRSQTGTNIYVTPRLKSGTISNCLVAGNGSNAHEAGIEIGNSSGVRIEACRFGYTVAHDGVAEAEQGFGVSLTSTALNTTISNSFGGDTYDAAVPMFSNATSGFWKFAKIDGCKGDCSFVGQFMVDGNGLDDNIGDADTTLTVGEDLPVQRYATTLTVNRVVTCSETGARRGDKFRVIRTGLGAFTLEVCGLKTIANSTAAFVDVIFEDDNDDGSGDWVLAGYGAL